MKFKWRIVIEGEIEAPSKEIVQAAVISQVSLTSNLCMGPKRRQCRGSSLHQTALEGVSAGDFTSCWQGSAEHSLEALRSVWNDAGVPGRLRHVLASRSS